jgi:tartrate dehydratase beta subunit/fumarate hydratase class I family protein
VCSGQCSFTGTIVTARKAFHHRVTEKASEREKKTTEVFLCDSAVKNSGMFAMTIKFDNFFPGVENSGDA